MNEGKTTSVGKISQLMFWNKQHQNSNSSHNIHKDGDLKESKGGGSASNNKDDSKSNKRNWLHTPDALINGHVVYLVKFFGSVRVNQPKGIEVVKDTIRKIQFSQQIKKVETGTQEKFKKVEITISVDGVAVQEPRTQKILYQFPLHNISYCADEKGIKKFFSFIVKTTNRRTDVVNLNPNINTNNTISNASPETATECHECFVFISNKLASDITLTIGQAFELAFKKYLVNSEKDELTKSQQQIMQLEQEISIYKNRLRELSQKLPKDELDAFLVQMAIQDILEIQQQTNTNSTIEETTTNDHENHKSLHNNNNNSPAIQTLITTKTTAFLPTVPPRNNLASHLINKTTNHKIEELLLNSDSDSDFDPRANENSLDDHNSNLSNNAFTKIINNDLFGFEPSKSFSHQQLSNNTTNNNITTTTPTTTTNNNNNNKTNLTNTTNSNNIFSELTITPPLLAPPPKAIVNRRNVSLANSSAGNISRNTDLFGSDPFEINRSDIFEKNHKICVDDFTLESLDPLRK